jgi:hypothetical protein
VHRAAIQLPERCEMRATESRLKVGVEGKFATGCHEKEQMTQKEKQGGFANSFQMFAAKASCWMGTKWSFVGEVT